MPPQPTKTIDPLFDDVYKALGDLEGYVDRLEKALVKYGEHEMTCRYFIDGKCDCGFKKAIGEILNKKGD